MAENEPVLVVSDVHLHNWSAYADTGANGVNTRLEIILDEFDRAINVLIDAAGQHCFVTGDLFHVRGNVAPSVLNPTIEAFRTWVDMGIKFHIIPGNHDLESKDAKALTNATMALSQINGVSVYNEPTLVNKAGRNFLVVPWVDGVDPLRERLTHLALNEHDEIRAETTLMIHAPMNAVIKGIPDHGLFPEELAALGFKRVYVGHYHNHKAFTGDVYSVGALTHQTWNDIDTVAGCIIDHGDQVDHHLLNAPSFVDVDRILAQVSASLGPKKAWDGIEDYVRGNYCRMKVPTPADETAVKGARKALLDMGAEGISLRVEPTAAPVSRGGSVKTENVPLRDSVTSYADSKGGPLKEQIQKEALDVLSEVEALDDAD